MADDSLYDIAITGGGLSGLAISILSASAGYKVILFEKEKYPFHRVCGEYISRESWNFLQGLGIDLTGLGVSQISKLEVSSVRGKRLEQALPLGGFGISRFLLDQELMRIAVKEGVVVMENTPIQDIQFDGKEFTSTGSSGSFRSKVAAGCYGKRGKPDIKWQRPFILAKKNKLNNYIGVKYHIRTDFPSDLIALHIFPGGYCGIVKVEGEKYNCCYLTTAANLQECGGDISKMEKEILSINPHLQKIFANAEKITEQPVTISQISFDKKSQIEDHVILAGDTAGMITPLCGNGMSMALHGAKIAAKQIDLFLRNKITRDQMEKNYSDQWQIEFGGRLKMGRRIQRYFGNRWLSNLLLSLGSLFPGISNRIIRSTHGKPF